MSLKNFHILFIALAAFCCLGFAAWAFWLAPADILDRTLRITGIASGVGGLALIVYGFRFAKKAKNMIL